MQQLVSDGLTGADRQCELLLGPGGASSTPDECSVCGFEPRESLQRSTPTSGASLSVGRPQLAVAQEQMNDQSQEEPGAIVDRTGAWEAGSRSCFEIEAGEESPEEQQTGDGSQPLRFGSCQVPWFQRLRGTEQFLHATGG